MPEPDFLHLRRELLAAGVTPRHVRRMVAEFEDHFDDLVAAQRDRGLTEPQARVAAGREFGDVQDLLVAVREHRELLGWSYRFPRLALVVYPLACVAALPVLPVAAGVAHAPEIARWSACLAAAALVTASMFLLLQLSILLT